MLSTISLKCRPRWAEIRTPISAREDLVVEVGAELAQGLAASGLLLAVPGQDGGLEDTSLIAQLLVQWDVAGFDAGHDVGAGDTDQVSRVLGAQNRVCRRFGFGGRRLSVAAADRRVLEELRELALDQAGCLGCQLD